MDQASLATRLAGSDERERMVLRARYPALVDIGLARALAQLYRDISSSDPAQAAGAAAGLSELARALADPEAHALAMWIGGLVALQLEGQYERAITLIDAATAELERIGQLYTAAATQVGKSYALAVLGRYDEAVICGLHARDVFLEHGDILAAGKIEQNLGNIYQRRGAYAEAGRLYNAARERFEQAGDGRLLAFAENGLATVLALRHDFCAATALYERALAHAESAGAAVTQAELECNLGCLALDQGHYDRALDYLERSRRRYVSLGMEHEQAVAELEIADAYLELNLVAEAAAIYARLDSVLADLGMRAERARTLAHYGRASAILGQFDAALERMREARSLYAAEGNDVGSALVTLFEAHCYYSSGDYVAAELAAAQAEAVLAIDSWEHVLTARWLRGEAARALGRINDSRALLESTLAETERLGQPQMAQRCHTSLGLLAAAEGDTGAAEAAFQGAVALIEELRTPLPGEEFRIAFVGDKQTPYVELLRLCLHDPESPRVVEGLSYVEQGRSRALLETLEHAGHIRLNPRDDVEAKLLAQRSAIREELSWFYSQLQRAPEGDRALSAVEIEELRAAARERESTLLDIRRRLLDHNESLPIRPQPLEITRLQCVLGPKTALVEYFALDGQLLAFIVTDERIEVVRDLGSEAQVAAALDALRFQIEALRYGASWARAHVDQLALRARHYLAELYELLLRPIESCLGARGLVVVPHRLLYYVPFYALYDGTGYVVERREVVCAPSAMMFCHNQERRPRPALRAALLGVPDERIPHVRAEIEALAPLFPEATVLLSEAATQAALREAAADADVLHLACHGQFRPDNPLFSALRLGDGWLTVRDVYDLQLRDALVVLSACETGMSTVLPGDEIIGLSRGFFRAGAAALLVSLWTVEDKSTVAFMVHFYTCLRQGDSPAAALRAAQRTMLARRGHPFFWAPFTLLVG
ncbi:MAG: CHAT domain-containing protein [Roseiflexaceae bacterium]